MTIAPRDRRAEPADVRTLRATGPADLLTLIPYLLGYHPHESLVIALICGARVRMCARLDLVDAARPGVLLGSLGTAVQRQQADGVILVAFGSDRTTGCSVVEDARRQFDGFGVPVIEAVYADGERWWSGTCESDCCPADGTPYDASAGPLAAEAVYAGLSVAADRSAIADSVAGPAESEWRRLAARAGELSSTEPELAALDQRSRSARQRRIERIVRAALGRHSEPDGNIRPEATPRPEAEPDPGSGPELGEDAALELALLARDVEVRDAAWSLMRADRADQHVRLWRSVVAHCPPELAVAPLCLVGAAAWIGGDGTLQMCCVERVHRLQPSCSMAGLLDDLNAQAAPPSLWEEIWPGLRKQIEASTRAGVPGRGGRERTLG